ncbi:ATP-binding protein [Tissierellaceae bacterium HCP3S3_D8]
MRKRILVNFIFILLVSAFISGALAFNFIKSSYIKSKEEKFLSNINLIKNTLNDNGDKLKEKDFFRLSQNLSSQTGSRVTFIRSDGTVIADSINNSIIFQNIKSKPEYRYAIKGEKQVIQRYSIETGNKFFYLAMPPVKVGELEIILRLGDDYQEIDHIIEKFLMYTIVANFIGLFFAIIIGYISTDRIIKPVKELTDITKLIADGNFNNRVEVNAEGEIKELSISFNQMIEKLEYTIDEIRDKNMKLDAILASMQEGLIALDQEYKVILINNSAKKILKIDDKIKIGSHVKEVILDSKITREIEKSLDENCELDKEIKVGGDNEKIIHLSMSIIQRENQSEDKIGTLIIIRDITSIRKLEKIRRDFVANVSHELRTPLTSISGFVETLKIRELDVKSRNKVIDIIEFETERLKRLINNLLELSEIESIKTTKSLTDIDITDDVNKIVELLTPLSDKKEIKIRLNIEEGLNTITGNKDWFRLILTNLIENSIKYTEVKGNIRINVSNHNSGVKLVIKDNGIGIPEEDLPRIFERFYRVDKSRSSIVEGSGIGLAIVKHIVILLKGTIEVRSKLGEGTCFIVLLP